MPAAVWTGRLAFGLVSIPVRLFRAARRERIRFHQVYRPPTENAGRQQSEEFQREAEPEPPRPSIVPARPVTRELAPAAPAPAEKPSEISAPPPFVERVHNAPPVEPSELLKGFEYDKDRYVVIEPAELAALRPRTSSELEILEFARLQEIDPIYFDTSYYLVPDKGGDKPYAMLFETLRQTGYAALGTFAMHGREHAAAIRPGRHGLILHTLFYENEIHAQDEHRVSEGQITPKEEQLAELFVRELAASFDPAKFKNSFEERVRELIEARAQSGLVPAQGTAEPAARKAPVVDILEALRKSLEMVRKPPRSAEAPAPPRRKRSAK